jgi:hypothetical protein
MLVGLMNWLQSPRRQAFIFTTILFVCYVVLSWPVERVTGMQLDGNLVYLSGGPIGMRILDISDPHSPHLLGALNTRGYAHNLVLKDKLAYVASDRWGVAIVQVADPASPKLSGYVETEGKSLDVAVWKNLVFSANGSQGLQVFKEKSDAAPEEIKEDRLKGNITRLVISGDRLFLTYDDRNLRIYQLSSDAVPNLKEIASYNAPGTVKDIVVDDTQVLIAADQAGLVGLDISKLDAISSTLTYNTKGQANGIAWIKPDYVLVADGKKGLVTLDIQDRKNVRELSTFDTWGNSTRVQVRNEQVFLADGLSGLRILEEQLVLKPELESTSPQSNTKESDRDDRFIYIADGTRGLRVFDGNLSNLHEVGFYDTPGTAMAVDTRSDKGRAYVADKEQLLIFDVASPDKAIRLLGTLAPGAEADYQDVRVIGYYAYLAQGQYGFGIVDIADDDLPIRVGKEWINGNAVGVDVVGEYAYVAAGYGGLNIVNITDKTLPTRVATLALAGEAHAVTALKPPDNSSAQIAYVAASREGVCVIDVSTPKKPHTINCNKTLGQIWDVELDQEQQRLYAVDDQGNLYIFAISDPTAPRPLGLVSVGVPLKGVTVVGDTAYLAAAERGLRVVNIADPSQAKLIFSYDYPPQARNFTVNANYAYVTDSATGMRILDITDRKKYKEVGYVRTPGQANSVFIEGEYAYIADGDSGVQVVNISRPNDPWLMNNGYNTDGRAVYLRKDGNVAYVADDDGGLLLLDVSDPWRLKKISSLREGLPGPARWVGLYHNDYVFVACQGGLASIYIKDNRNPILLDVYTELPDIRSFVVSDKYALVAAGGDGFVTLDISHPLRIEKLDQVDTSAPAVHVTTYGGLAFLANGTGGIQIFSLYNYANPQLVGSTTEPKQALMVRAEWIPPDASKTEPGSYWVYVADDSQGLETFYSKKSGNLVQLGVYETPGTASLYEVFNYIALGVNNQWAATDDALQTLGLNSLATISETFRKKVVDKATGLVKRLGTTWPQTGQSAKAGRTLWLVFVVDFFVLGFLGLLLWVSFAAQYALPVRGFSQRKQAVDRLHAYLSGKHGVMARVHDGRIFGDAGDQGHHGPGVALVDLSSAVVLEKQIQPRSTLSQIMLDLFGEKGSSKEAAFGVDKTGQAIPPERVEGPGLVFTQSNSPLRGIWYDERLSSAVDLHNQVRTITGVKATTRDGIEVTTNVFCVFSVSLKPDLLLVTFDGSTECSNNLRVMYIEEREVDENGGGKQKRKFIRDLVDELEPEDRDEIFQFLRRSRARRPVVPAPIQEEPSMPYRFDRARTFAAAASRAIGVQDQRYTEWSELPAKTAIEIFRRLLSTVEYNELYHPTEAIEKAPEKVYQITKFKSNFGVRVRNQGMLAYQVVESKDGSLLKKGQILVEQDLYYYPVRELRSPRVLRARGIKVVTASFTELDVDPAVRRTMLDKWLAHWQREAELRRVDFDLRAARIRSNARAEAHRDMIGVLSSILNDKVSDTALAMRLFQALESAAADPHTRQLLPAETLEAMKLMRSLLENEVVPPYNISVTGVATAAVLSSPLQGGIAPNTPPNPGPLPSNPGTPAPNGGSPGAIALLAASTTPASTASAVSLTDSDSRQTQE